MALGMGARVTILDKSAERLAYLDDIFHGRVTTVMSNNFNIAEWVAKADLLVGAVLIPGAKAPKLVSEEMVKSMSPGLALTNVTLDYALQIANKGYIKAFAENPGLAKGVNVIDGKLLIRQLLMHLICLTHHLMKQ